MSLHDALDVREADAGALERDIRMQALEHTRPERDVCERDRFARQARVLEQFVDQRAETGCRRGGAGSQLGRVGLCAPSMQRGAPSFVDTLQQPQ